MKTIKNWFAKKYPEYYAFIALIWWVMKELWKEDENEVKP